METHDILIRGVVALHSLLRWLIVIFLLINIIRSFLSIDESKYNTSDLSWNYRLLFVTHINWVIGLGQYFFGAKGFAYFSQYGFGEIMKNSVMRFRVLEHPLLMITAVVLITISRKIARTPIQGVAKPKHRKLGLFYSLALLAIIVAIPWPSREAFDSYPWVRVLN